MQDFLERTLLENGLEWTAEYKGHDWARHFNFYFLITLYQDSAVVKRFPVEVSDYKYGDTTCEYTDDEIRQKIRQELHYLAQRGVSNTQAIF